MKKNVSVITASYGHENYIAHAIESVLNQTHADFDYIIFDDGSKDSSRNVIEKYAQKDSRIRFYTHENIQNKGLPATIKAALDCVQTPYVAFLESDDLWEPSFLEEMLDVAKKRQDVGLFFSGVQAFGEDEHNNKAHTKMLERRKRFIQQRGIVRMDLLYSRVISTFSSVLARTSVLKACRLDPIIPQRLDHYLWAQCLLQMPALYVDKILCHWRKHDAGFSCGVREPFPFASEDMLFDVLYPENTKKDKAFYHYLLSGKKEKAFRNQLRAFLRFYFHVKYPLEKLIVYTK